MLSQALDALLIGVVIGVVAFVPYVLYQYRRYGRFTGARLAWSAALLVYGVALITYTLFPLPSADQCRRSTGVLVLDPTIYWRDVWSMHQAGASLWSIASSWTVLQVVLNIALFVPLGLIMRHLWEAGIVKATLTGLCLSVLIEATQFTGDWWLAPCPYRVADVNDLIANTAGAVFGWLLAGLIPDFTPDVDDLVADRRLPRPVHRRRHWLAMAFDALVLVLIEGAGLLVFFLAVQLFTTALPWSQRVGSTDYLGAVGLVIGVVGLLVVIVPALFGDGASIGQRIVYLRPRPRRRPPRLWLVWRAMSVEGLALISVIWLPNGWLWAGLWLLTACIWVLVTPRGLSFTLAQCDLVDARGEQLEAPPPAAEAVGQGPASLKE
ncbi:MAG: VanZ family protein [Propionibacteriaceae bacterium]|jgi:glycopeptide antibiotics resistance protein|nr:VanZ family protein [Propionibacteriaceae bacterium]